ncbi:hypothetical protein IAD21_00565 [Abditibacteriota bacterium]|nr:hypothetical protein IAD21_00565 [Abditibacteriota bacterium]
MAIQLAPCPNCGQMNSYTSINCLDCKKPLPWAEAALQMKAAEQAASVAQQQAFQAQAEAEAAKNRPVGPVSTQGKLNFCPKCHTRIPQGANHCPSCGVDWRARNSDAPSFLPALLGFLFWPGGILIWILQHDSHPHRAASAGRGALVGIFVGMVLGMVGYYYRQSVVENSPRHYYIIPADN